MKKLFVIAIFLAACGSNSSKTTDEAQKKLTNDTTEKATDETPEGPNIESAKESSTNPIIGKPKKLGSIQIAEKDFPTKMTWKEATAACAELGSGWRLPTKEELNEIYINKDQLGGFNTKLYDFYWTSSESGYLPVYVQDFSNGKRHYYTKDNHYYGRAVMAL